MMHEIRDLPYPTRNLNHKNQPYAYLGNVMDVVDERRQRPAAVVHLRGHRQVAEPHLHPWHVQSRPSRDNQTVGIGI